MINPFIQSISTLPILDDGVTRAITAENRKGEKGVGGQASSNLGPGRKGSPCLYDVAAGSTEVIAEIDGPGIINHIWITVPTKTDHNNVFVLRDVIIRMYWDDEEHPSVEVPLGDFFCLGFGAVYPVNSQLVSVNPRGGMNCYFQMPFKKNARIEIVNEHRNALPLFFYQIDYTLYKAFPEDLELAYFHAQWRRTPITTKGEDHVLLDGVQGKGKYIGTFFAIQTLNRYWWGEGEVKFFLDGDDDFPTLCGTGTEDYFGGAWCYTKEMPDGRYEEQQYSTPYLGYPYFSDRDDTIDPYMAHDDTVVPMRALYRWHVLDPIRFEKDLKVTVQSIGLYGQEYFEREDDIATVSYWYQTHPHAEFKPLPPARERWPR